MTLEEIPSGKSVRRVAVIGGGITGLAAAHRLISTTSDTVVTLFDSSNRLGGIIQTQKSDGFLMECGPDSFITNKPGAVQLCEEIGFSDQLISTDNAYRRSLVLRKGRPVAVPDGFMLMAPSKPWSIATTPILSVTGKLRLLAEVMVSRKTTEDDESLASFVRRRFGRETLDRLVQPLVGGIYTSDPEKLSLQATLPRFLDMEHSHGSVIRATLSQQRAAKRKGRQQESEGSGARYGLFATARDGLSSMVDAVATVLNQSPRFTLQLNENVQQIGREANSLFLKTAAGDQKQSFDAVINTLPAARAAELLDTYPNIAAQLKTIEYASSAVVITAHRIQDFQHPLDAFGLVIPWIEGRRILAVSFTSRKFPGRAPADHILLRTFVGGAMQPELLNCDDRELNQIVSSELSDLLGMTRPPLFSRVVRYTNAMPQYHVGHTERIRSIMSSASEVDGLELAGNAYAGVGLPDCIASGRAAADRIVAGSTNT